MHAFIPYTFDLTASWECGICPTDFCPVCGTDEFTYPSECELRRTACIRGTARLETAYEGECLPGFLELRKWKFYVL